MAKTGFSFYRADTDRFQDIRIKRLKKELKCNGYAVYSYILNEIYRVKGCYMEWDESTAFDVSEYWDLKESQVEEIVKYCCAIGLFDKGLFTSGRVITSRAIQIRYIEMNKIAKRTNFDIPKDICLIPEEMPKLPEEIAKIQKVSDKEKNNKEKNRKEIPPLSPTGGSGGGSFFNLSRNDPPPSDGVKRNYEALTRELTSFKLSPDEFNTICELSNYGEIGNPVWKLLQKIRDSREGKFKIDHPGRFLISRLKGNG